MNHALSTLPPHCDVLVVGAGPAGSACAQWLARQGLAVVQVDQQSFPRDKVCGDGLIPDAHHALQRLGVHDEVMAQAQAVAHVGCIGPRGGRVDVPGRLAVLPRRELDHILQRAAVRAGAHFFAPWRFEAPLLDAAGERVVGARLKAPGAAEGQALRARWVVLATGAAPKPLQAAGVCERHTPSGIALRGYVKNQAMVGRIQALEVVWHKRLRKGYGWIFPCRDGVFNIGVGLAHSHDQAVDGKGSMQDVNLRELFSAFTEVHPHAAQLMAGGSVVGELKGAPLRCSLEGARWSRPGLLVTGEAAGSTYAFTGEGIGKAMETGLLAAEALLGDLGMAAAPGSPRAVPDTTPDAATDAAVRQAYEQGLAALKPRFDLYERANRVNHHPWLADLLIWRANKSARILRRMAGVLEETGNPGNLVSLRGIAKLFIPSL
ncbi:NAD(P)/FAD-dependent oxidoreductase [Aquabacterium sp. OR-4]|uniref:NAD(P)/FAD-dependent oxidoreductase n=1 Tax=Aquabacterium sp. OR-4 TaxID=2978127 RepID=UPI0021B400A8|nr:geranylgeranyl reductase family protein [Aquabacterium sp. OR-4]MDT7834009.1 geranylgeranyl reductase family protein [Aquabacterium sp. OR-4]